jgi:hypothetical protein
VTARPVRTTVLIAVLWIAITNDRLIKGKHLLLGVVGLSKNGQHPPAPKFNKFSFSKKLLCTSPEYK